MHASSAVHAADVQCSGSDIKMRQPFWASVPAVIGKPSASCCFDREGGREREAGSDEERKKSNRVWVRKRQIMLEIRERVDRRI